MYEFVIELDEYYKPVEHFLTEELFQKIVSSKFFSKQQKKISKSSNDLKKMNLDKKLLKYYIEPSFLKKSNIYGVSKKVKSKKSITMVPLKSMTKSKKSITLPRLKSGPKSITMSPFKSGPKSSTRRPLYEKPHHSYNPNYPLIAHGGGDNNNDNYYNLINTILIPLALFSILQLYRINTRNRNYIREIINISGNKSNVRLVFALMKEDGAMDFLKVSALENAITKEDILQNPTLMYDDYGEYVYECRIYDKMNQHTGINYKEKDISKYISEILDWNIKKIDLDSLYYDDSFLVNGVDINQLYPFGLCKKIYENNWSYPSSYYCYSLVKGYPNFINFSEYISNGNYTHLLDIFQNGVSLLNLFWNTKGYVHWDLHYDNLLVNPDNGEVKFFDFDLSEVGDSLSIRNIVLTDELDQIINKFRELYPNENPNIFDSFNSKLLGHMYDFYRFIIEPLEYNIKFRQYINNNILPDNINNNADMSWYRKIISGFIVLGILNEINPPYYDFYQVNFLEEAEIELKNDYETIINLPTTSLSYKKTLKSKILFNGKLMTALHYFYNIE